MTTIPFTYARAKLSELFTEVCTKGERIVIERYGHERVAMVPIEVFEAIEQMKNNRDINKAENALNESDDRIPWEEVKKGLKL